MKIKRDITAGLLLLSICMSVRADHINYGYDASGNRTSRTIVINPRGSIDTQDGDDHPFQPDI